MSDKKLLSALAEGAPEGAKRWLEKLGLVFIGVAVTAAVCTFLFERIIAAKDATIEQKNAENETLKTKVDAATPDAVISRVDKLEAHLKVLESTIVGRHLTGAQIEALRHNGAVPLVVRSQYHLTVTTDVNCWDCGRYGSFLAGAMANVYGWRTSWETIMGPPEYSDKGLMVLVRDPLHITGATALLINALKAANIAFDQYNLSTNLPPGLPTDVAAKIPIPPPPADEPNEAHLYIVAALPPDGTDPTALIPIRISNTSVR
jgi:hypothetical protein